MRSLTVAVPGGLYRGIFQYLLEISIFELFPTCQERDFSVRGKEFLITLQHQVSCVVLQKLNSALGTLYLLRNHALLKACGLLIHFHPCFARRDWVVKSRCWNPRPPSFLRAKSLFLLRRCIRFSPFLIETSKEIGYGSFHFLRILLWDLEDRHFVYRIGLKSRFDESRSTTLWKKGQFPTLQPLIYSIQKFKWIFLHIIFAINISPPNTFQENQLDHTTGRHFLQYTKLSLLIHYLQNCPPISIDGQRRL